MTRCPCCGFDLSAPVGSKTCKACRQIKPLAEFYVRLESSDGRFHRCRSCLLLAKRERKAAPAKGTP